MEEITLTSAVYDTERRYVLVRIGITSNLFQFPLEDPNDPSFKNELERGFRVRLAYQGLTGVAYLEADYLRSGTQSTAGNRLATQIPSTSLPREAGLSS